jgi:hypothetical protein
VSGKGNTEFKEGWWWVVSVHDETRPEDIAKFYREQFKTDGQIYMEISPSMGSYKLGN